MKKNGSTLISQIADDASCPPVGEFTPIGDIELMEVSTQVNVKGEIAAIGEIQQTGRRGTGEPLILREIEIGYKSFRIRLVLWQQRATDFNGEVGHTVIVLNAVVKEYNGKMLTGSRS